MSDLSPDPVDPLAPPVDAAAPPAGTVAPAPFARLAEVAEAIEATRGRNAMADLAGGLLRSLAPAEIAPAARFLIGRVFAETDTRTLDLSWAAVWKVARGLLSADEAAQRAVFAEHVDAGSAVGALLHDYRVEPVVGPPLGLLEVFEALAAVAAESGAGSAARREAALLALFRRATPAEAKQLAKIVLGEMRHGASEGTLLDALARTTGLPRARVARANQLTGDIGELARLLLFEGEAGLARLAITLYRPLKPMLAETAETVADAWAALAGQLALEYKLDGARVQLHLGPAGPRIYSRTLSDVTASLPDVVAAAAGLAVDPAAGGAIVEGEVMALDPAGRPLPFQTLMRRFRRVQDVAETAREVPAELFLFDALMLDGAPLLDLPYAERWARLERAAGTVRLTPRLLPADLAAAEAGYARALADGHEGLVAKRLDSPYTPGRRGGAWLKLKRAVTLDLVIVAADWGYGRRHGWLSNYHLAVYDPDTGRYLDVGKTFKGLTDAEFADMTARLLELKRDQRGSTVSVEPKLVVEVAFNEILDSPRYASKLALRHARILRLRPDKPPEAADTLATLRALHAARWTNPDSVDS